MSNADWLSLLDFPDIYLQSSFGESILRFYNYQLIPYLQDTEQSLQGVHSSAQ